MKLHELSLLARITIGALAMVVAGTMALVYVENAHLRESYLSERRAHLERNIEAEMLRLNHAIDTLRQDALFLSNTPPVSGIVRAALNHGYDARYGNTDKVWKERLQQIFSVFSIAHPDYFEIRYIGLVDGGRELVRIDNRDGKIEITPPDRLQAERERDYFKATLGLRQGQVFFSTFNLDQERGAIEQSSRPTLRASTPVFTPDGKLFGMVVISLDVENLLKSAVSDLPGVQSYLANRDGQYLLHPDARQAFKFELGGKDNIATDFPFIKTMFDPQAEGYQTLQTVTTRTGNSLFIAKRIHFDSGDPSRFLLLMYYLPAAVVAQQAATLPASTFIYEFIAMLLVGGIVMLILRRTFSPLEQIAAAADKIAAGGQDTLPLPAGGGEIGSLANALNAMLTRLAQRENLLRESESRFRNLVETTSDWIWEVDENAVYTYTSPQIRRILGYEAAEIIGKTPFDLMPPEEAKRVAGIFGAIAAARKPFANIENTNLHKDGHPVVLETSGVPVINAEGKFCGYRGIDRDVTERKRGENAIIKAGEKFHILFDSIADSIFITGMDGRFIQVNRSACERLGYSQEELLQMGPTDIDSPEYAAKVPERLRALLEQGSLIFESAHVRRDGAVIPIELNARVIDYDGKPAFLAVARDITERRRLEAGLRRSEENLNLAQTVGQIGSWILDIATGRLEWSAETYRIFGIPPQQAIDQAAFIAATHPEDRDFALKAWGKAMAGSPYDIEHRIVVGEKIRWVRERARIERDAEGRALTGIGTVQDVTERRRANELLRKSLTEVEDLYNNAPCGYHSLDKDGVICRINNTELAWLGYARHEVLGKMKWCDLITPASQENFKKDYPQLMRQGHIDDIEVEIIRKDGTVFDGLVNATAIYDSGGNFVMSRSMLSNITARKQMEQQLRDLSAHLMSVREEEKFNIAREIHDDLGGTLTALNMKAYLLKTELSAHRETAAFLEHIGAMSQLIDNAARIMRKIITGLRPTILDDLGILAALEWQAAQFQKYNGIECRVNYICAVSEDSVKKLDKLRSIALFRIAQEALTNVAKHSGASWVEIEFLYNEEEVVMSIIDNGRGMAKNRTDPAIPYGILGMCERVDQLGGMISFDTPPGAGFSVTVILPQPANKEMEET